MASTPDAKPATPVQKMKLSCRLGWHAWAHLGVTRTKVYNDDYFTHNEYNFWKRCCACGRLRRYKRTKSARPPEALLF